MINQIELSLFKEGKSIIGVDEVGRGCIAGPVYAACVSINYQNIDQLNLKEKILIRDSKTLSFKQRLLVYENIIDKIAIEYHVAFCDLKEIEELGILKASLLAMQKALNMCKYNYDLLLVDGNHKIPTYKGIQMPIINGDKICFCIAAASIIAKVQRDLYMIEQSKYYPQYSFDKHVGYATKLHLKKIYQHGICPLHRKTFKPISLMIKS